MLAEGCEVLGLIGVIADNGGTNEQEEIMEKVNEKGQAVEKEAIGIKEERLNALKGNYQRPNFREFGSNDGQQNKQCSDMASSLCPKKVVVYISWG